MGWLEEANAQLRPASWRDQANAQLRPASWRDQANAALATPRRATLQNVTGALEEALPALSVPAKARAYQGIAQIEDPEEQQRSLQRLKAGESKVSALSSAVTNTAAQLGREGQNEEAIRLSRLGGLARQGAEALIGEGGVEVAEDVARRAAAKVEPIARPLASGGRAVLEALDVPRQALHAAGIAAIDPNVDLGTEAWRSAADPEALARTAREGADRGDPLALGLDATKRVLTGIAHVPGAALAGAGQAFDLATGVEPSMERFKKDTSGAAEAIGNFAFTAATDPLTILPAGAIGKGARALAETNAPGRKLLWKMAERDVAKELQLGARGDAALREKRYLGKLGNLAEGIGKLGVSPERLDELVDLAVDPWAPGRAGAPFPLAPNEEKAAKAIKAYGRARYADTAKARVEIKANANPESGAYFPRQYRSQESALDELARNKARASRTSNPREPRILEGEGIPRARARTDPDLAYLKPVEDPLEALALDARKRAGLEAQQQLAFDLAEQLGRPAQVGSSSTLKGQVVGLKTRDGRHVEVPAALYNIAFRPFDQSFRTMAGVLKRTEFFTNPITRPLVRAAEWGSKAMGVFKRQATVMRPAFHGLAAFNDLLQSAAYGLTNPLPRLVHARRAISQGAGPLAPLLAEARARGLVHGSLNDIDLARQVGKGRATDELNQRLQKGLGQTPSAGARLRGAVKRGYYFGDDVAQSWRDHIELALFAERVARGDTFDKAARTVMDALIDYGDTNQMMQIARWFMPFAKYTFNAPVMAAKQIAHNPKAAVLPERLAEASSKKEGNEPRSYVTESGTFYRAPDSVAQRYGRARELLGGSPVPKGVDLVMTPRTPVPEAFSPFTALAGGNVDPLVSGLAPPIRAGIEMATGQNAITKRPAAKFGEMGLVPSGMPGMPAWAQSANPEHPGWLTQVAWPYLPGLGAPPVTAALNAALFYGAGGTPAGASPAYLGQQRPVSSRAENQIAQGAIGQVWPFRTYEARPEDAWLNLASLPAVQRAAAAARVSGAQQREIDFNRRFVAP